MTGAAAPSFRRVVLLYDGGAAAGDAASRDVFQQLDAVEAVLRNAGVDCRRLAAGLNLAALKADLAAAGPDAVFNLVESLDGSDRLQTLVAMALEEWRRPFTGCRSGALFLSNDKLRAKAFLAARGLPVPECFVLDAAGRPRCFPWSPGGPPVGDYIVKTVDSHASLYLDDASVLRSPDAEALADALRRAGRRHGREFFAERYIEGREFNLSLLAGRGERPRALPAAEISFSGLPPGRPRIVGYDAKWEEDSVAYLGTSRTFDFPPGDAGLLSELAGLAAAVWEALGLSGYARVDFRVDAAGRPFILEANANPCLAPDAGLAAAAARAGCDYRRLVLRILEDAREGEGRGPRGMEL